MGQLVLKWMITAGLVVLVSEAARRSSLLGGLLASLPIVSVMALIWLYWETRSSEAVQALSISIFWMVLPSLVLFVGLSWLLKKQMPFFPALGLSCVATILAYYLMLSVLRHLDIRL